MKIRYTDHEASANGSESTPLCMLRSKAFALSLFLLCAALLSAGRGQSASLQLFTAFADDDQTTKEADKEMKKGRFEKAARIYLDLIKKNPGDVRSRLGASMAFFKIQNYELGFDQAYEALKLEPNNSRAHALVGITLLRSGFLPQAMAELSRAVTINPKEALAYGGFAEIDYYENRAKESRSKSFYAYTLDPEEPDYLITYARACSRLEMFGEAADAYDRFLQIAPRTDSERRDRIRGLIQFYRELSGIRLHQITGPKSSAIQFWLGSDRRPYVRLKINGKDANLVIDTGSGFTVIAAASAKRLRVSSLARGGNSQGVGGNGKFPIIYGLINTANIGDFRIESVPCFIREFHNTDDRPREEKADGFIGLSVLSNFLTEIDYAAHSMTLTRSSEVNQTAAIGPDAPTVVKFRTTQNGLISIETQLDGNHNINAILDSGASSTVISTAAVTRLKMKEKIIKGQTVPVVGAAGISPGVEMLYLSDCQVADLGQNNMRALVMDLGAINETSGFEQSGILGGDFLRHFRLTIDFSRSQVAFEPQTAAITRRQSKTKLEKVN